MTAWSSTDFSVQATAGDDTSDLFAGTISLLDGLTDVAFSLNSNLI